MEKEEQITKIKEIENLKKIFKRLQLKGVNPEKESELLQKIGKLYEESEDYKNAIKYYKKNVTLWGKNTLEGAIAGIDIGQLYCNLQKEDKAIKYFEKYYKVAKEQNSIIEMQRSACHLGNLFLNKSYCESPKNNIESLKVAKKWFEISYESIRKLEKEKLDSYKLGLVADSELNLGIIYWELDNYEEAIEYLEKSVKKSFESQDLERIERAINNINSIYENSDKEGEIIKKLKQYHLMTINNQYIGPKIYSIYLDYCIKYGLFNEGLETIKNNKEGKFKIIGLEYETKIYKTVKKIEEIEQKNFNDDDIKKNVNLLNDIEKLAKYHKWEKINLICSKFLNFQEETENKEKLNSLKQKIYYYYGKSLLSQGKLSMAKEMLTNSLKEAGKNYLERFKIYYIIFNNSNLTDIALSYLALKDLEEIDPEERKDEVVQVALKLYKYFLANDGIENLKKIDQLIIQEQPEEENSKSESLSAITLEPDVNDNWSTSDLTEDEESNRPKSLAQSFFLQKVERKPDRKKKLRKKGNLIISNNKGLLINENLIKKESENGIKKDLIIHLPNGNRFFFKINIKRLKEDMNWVDEEISKELGYKCKKYENLEGEIVENVEKLLNYQESKIELKISEISIEETLKLWEHKEFFIKDKGLLKEIEEGSKKGRFIIYGKNMDEKTKKLLGKILNLGNYLTIKIGNSQIDDTFFNGLINGLEQRNYMNDIINEFCFPFNIIRFKLSKWAGLYFKSLKILDLGHNFISDTEWENIEMTFSKASNLRILDLGYNEIRGNINYIEPIKNIWPRLEKIILSGNPISEVRIFQRLKEIAPNLKEIEISNTEIEDLKWISNFEMLRKIEYETAKPGSISSINFNLIKNQLMIEIGYSTLSKDDIQNISKYYQRHKIDLLNSVADHTSNHKELEYIKSKIIKKENNNYKEYDFYPKL